MKNIDNSKNTKETIRKKPKNIKKELEGLQKILEARSDHSDIAKDKLGFDMEKTNTLAGINYIAEITSKYGKGEEIKKIAFDKGLIV